MSTNTQQDGSAFVFPEDSLTATSDSTKDAADAANFSTYDHAGAFTDHVEQGMTFTVDHSVPDVDISAGKAAFEVSSRDGRDATDGSTISRDQGHTVIGDSAGISGLSLTDSAVNEIFVFLDLSDYNQLKFQARTDSSDPVAAGDGDVALKIGEVDTSADTKDEDYNRDWTLRNDLDANSKDIFGAKGVGVGVDSIDGRVDIKPGTSTFIGGPTSAPADGDFGDGQISFWLDESSDEIEVKAKESDGTTIIEDTIGSGSGTAVALDIDDDDSNESSSLSEIATTGDTNDVVTEDSADKALFDFSKNWPTSDVAEKIDHPDDGGAVTHTDMTVTSSPSDGDEESFELDIDGNSFIKLYSEADGSGGIKNSRIELDQNISMDDGTTEISSSELNLLDGMTSLTGSDSNFVSGTSGTDGNVVEWNSDGDAVDSGTATSDVATNTGDTFTGNLQLNDDKELQFGDKPDYWFIYDSGNTQFELMSTDINGSDTDGSIFRVPDGQRDLKIDSDIDFEGLSGNPSFSGHDHTTSDMTNIPNAGLKNTTIGVTASDGLSGGGSPALGGSTSLDVRLDIDDSGSDVTGAYGIDFGNNMSVTDDGDNTVTVKSTASGGQTVVLDLTDDGSNQSEDLGEIATTGDSNGIFTEPNADKLLIDVSKNWPTADSAASLTLGDNETVAWGTDDDYEMEYVSGSSRFEFRNSTGDIFRVDDGTQVLDIIGGIDFDTGGNTVSSHDEDGIDRSSGSSETFTIQNSGSGSMELQVSDTISLDGGTTSIGSTEINILDGMTSKTGSDTNFATGTAGTSGNLAEWNADGDLVGSGKSTGDFLLDAGDTMTGALQLNDDVDQEFGSAPDYALRYDSGNTQFEFETKDGDGGGTTQTVFKVDDGTRQLDFEGSVLFNNGSLAFDLADQATDPANNGEFARNGSDVKVFSGGSVRNLSNIGGSTVTSTVIQDRTVSGRDTVTVPLHDTDGDYSEIRVYLIDAQPSTKSALTATVFDTGGDSFNTGSNYDIADQTNLSSFEFTEPSGESQHNVGTTDTDGFQGAIKYKNPGASQQTHNFTFSGVWNDSTDDQSIDATGTFDTGSSTSIKAMKISSGSGTIDGTFRVVGIE